MLLGVDVGGTFTDAVLVRDGRLISAKAPTTPADQSIGVLAAVEAALRSAGDDDGEQADAVTRFAHGMTVATNALLEGRAARTALIATAGFTDLVELGRQARPELYRLCAANPPPLVPPQLRFAAPERMGPNGPLRALEEPAALEMLAALARSEPEAVAVVLLHSYADPAHELQLARLLRGRLPADVHVSLSHEVVGSFREYERAATTEVDAALSPLLARYLDRLRERAAAAGLPAPEIMQSSGGLADAELAASHAALTVLSGPAGGALAATLLAGERDVVCFDMGGTSCDVCVVQGGSVRETSERSVGGRPLALPMIDIHTVGAGGGSIAWRDAGGALRVGPRSAGADPGPACYGRGGSEPTVTDANLLLERLPPSLAGGVELDAGAAERAIAALAAELDLDPLECARGIVRVADAAMAGAVRVMTVERGLDPRAFALLPFGGAGPLHACAIAEELGIDTILCPRASGVLSALGLASAAPRRDAVRSVLLSGGELSASVLVEQVEELRTRAARELRAHPVRARARLELRYRGQSFELAVERELATAGAPEIDPDDLRERFEQRHEQRYGYRDAGAEVELVTIAVSLWGAAPELALEGPPELALEPRGAGGERLAGPAVMELPEATLYIAEGWSGASDERGTIVLERTPAASAADTTIGDPA